jgi:hypothetical protein
MQTEEPIDVIRAAARRVETSVAAVAEAKEALQRQALRALVNLDGDEQERELVRTLYWQVLELPVKTLEVAVGSRARMRELAGPGPVLGTCDECGVEVQASSRTQLAAGSPRCKPCEAKPRQPLWSPSQLDGEADVPLPDEPPAQDADLDDWDRGW